MLVKCDELLCRHHEGGLCKLAVISLSNSFRGLPICCSREVCSGACFRCEDLTDCDKLAEKIVSGIEVVN
jgi:hypothetical protein